VQLSWRTSHVSQASNLMRAIYITHRQHQGPCSRGHVVGSSTAAISVSGVKTAIRILYRYGTDVHHAPASLIISPAPQARTGRCCLTSSDTLFQYLSAAGQFHHPCSHLPSFLLFSWLGLRTLLMETLRLHSLAKV
jgi:hypothetical protein